MLNINNMGVKELREACVLMGVDPGTKSKEELVSALVAKNKEIESLRLECARKGLTTTGTESELRLRLVATEEGSVTAFDRKLYNATGKAFLTLGLLALLVSVPHMTSELARVTGLPWLYALALAIVIDGAICVAKLADVVSGKFKLGNIVYISRVLLIAALAFSAAVNASGFVQGGESGTVLAVLFALLISGTVYAAFAAAAYILMVEEKRDAEVDVDPVQQLKGAADSLNGLLNLARSAKK